MDIENLKSKLRAFSKERDWEQFHNPKNISTALSVEASELLEIFQWSNDGGLSEINDPKKRKQDFLCLNSILALTGKILMRGISDLILASTE
mgnify:CR=1 FL=1